MPGNNMFSERDTMDINELASLNGDISPEFIEQLQQKISQETQGQSDFGVEFNPEDDTTLFEETNELSEEKNSEPPPPFEDKFLKKFQAKKNAIMNASPAEEVNNSGNNAENHSINDAVFAEQKEASEVADKKELLDNTLAEEKGISSSQDVPIEQVSKGNITEKRVTAEQKSYNDSLDFLDGNVKYSKYVIYIDPQNVDFIEGLTVKERKNLINNIIKEQNDIGITKQRCQRIQMIIRQSIVAILTLAISIPIIYYVINASLEASINNYRRSQTNFQVLYREKGKITKN